MAMVVWQLIAMLERSSELSFEARHAATHSAPWRSMPWNGRDRNGVRGGDRAMMAWKHREREREAMHAGTHSMYVVQREEQECMNEREEERKRWMERGREKKQLDAHITCVLSKVVRVCHKYLSIYPIYIYLSLPILHHLPFLRTLSLALFR